MSKKPKGVNIPWALIIFLYIVQAWPIAILLTLLRVLPLNSKASPAHRSTNTASAPQTTPHTQSTATAAPEKSETKGKPKKKKEKNSAGVVLRIVAIVLLALGALVGMVTLGELIAYGFHASGVEDLVLSLYMFLGGGVCYWSGNLLRRRERDRIRYRAMIGARESFSLAKLSTVTSYKIQKIKRDLQRMIDDGEFGDQAYIDMSNLCFMRTPDAQPDGVAEQYGQPTRRTMSRVAEDLSAAAAAAASMQTKKDASAAEAEETPDMSDFSAVLRHIRQLDDDIKDDAVSERIRKIEAITRNIFEYVDDKPEKMKQIRMFMNYYLPTTLKLLASYRRIERVGVAGQNMREAKANIEQILDMLVVGFEQQFDQLFKSESLDISSDIEVLEQMMSKDGLKENDDFVLRTEDTDSFSDDITDEFGGGIAVRKQ